MCFVNSSQLPNEENSGFLEIASVSWATSVFVKGFKKTLTTEDLGELSRTLTAKASKDKLIKIYAEESVKHHGDDVPLTQAFWKTVRTKLLLSIVLLIIYLTVEFSKAVSKWHILFRRCDIFTVVNRLLLIVIHLDIMCF